MLMFVCVRVFVYVRLVGWLFVWLWVHDFLKNSMMEVWGVVWVQGAGG